MVIRESRDSDLFHDSVHAISKSLYTTEQLEVWAPTPPSYLHWQERLLVKKPLVAEIMGVIVGFIKPEVNGHIDCFYVHSDYQGKGVGSKLFQHCRNIEVKKGISKFNVEASKVAKPFFEKVGFDLQSTNIVDIRGQSLTNLSNVFKCIALTNCSTGTFLRKDHE
jgi:putative acetyltransferase